MKAGPEASQEYFSSLEEDDFTTKLTAISTPAGEQYFRNRSVSRPGPTPGSAQFSQDFERIPRPCLATAWSLWLRHFEHFLTRFVVLVAQSLRRRSRPAPPLSTSTRAGVASADRSLRSSMSLSRSTRA